MNVHTLVTNADRCRLGRLLSSDSTRGVATWNALDELEFRLEEAEAMTPETIPDDVVTMNSTVRLINVESAEEITCTVVYPDDVELIDDGLSVLDPLGTRLIGCEAGDVIEFQRQSSREAWLIAEIVFQPERVSSFHL